MVERGEAGIAKDAQVSPSVSIADLSLQLFYCHAASSVLSSIVAGWWLQRDNDVHLAMHTCLRFFVHSFERGEIERNHGRGIGMSQPNLNVHISRLIFLLPVGTRRFFFRLWLPCSDKVFNDTFLFQHGPDTRQTVLLFVMSVFVAGDIGLSCSSFASGVGVLGCTRVLGCCSSPSA